MQPKKSGQSIILCPEPTLTKHPPTNQTVTITTTHTHQTLNNHKTSYLYDALPSVTEFNQMSDRKAIECICMILPISEEEVKQENHQLRTPHNWHDVATTIINKTDKNPTNKHSAFKRQNPHHPQQIGKYDLCKGNPNSLDKQLFSQDLVRGNPK
jgi:hypothetical protein